MPARRSPLALESLERLCHQPTADRPLRIAVLDELRLTVPFDWHAWLLTDPESEVGSAPLADTPLVDDLPRLIRSKYLSEVNRWTSLASTAVSLHDATDGDLTRSHVWREVLAGHGISDVASMVFRDPLGCWGWLDLWRGADTGPFGRDDLAYLTAAIDPITNALRRSQALTFDGGAALSPSRGPVVMVLSPDIEVKAQTPATENLLRSLVPPDGDRRPIPAGAYNVAAQLLAVEAGVDSHPPTARVHLGAGTWLTLRAARVDSGGSSGDSDIAVTIEPAGPSERRSLYCRSHGLSPRETELVEMLAQGGDTRAVAAALFVSEHTVQDHLKSIFAKTVTRNRRTLLSRLAGG